MSPEQLSGNESPDRRTDVFSLGCVLYEMIAGRPPYSSRKVSAARLERERDGTPEVRSLVADVPADVEKLIRRAMAERPVERFQSAPSMLRALEEALESELQRAP
jgi:serine/threonine-protein kinase